MDKDLCTQLILIVVGVLVITIAARITVNIPFYETEIPITGQSLAVLLVGFLGGIKRGSLVVLLYLIIGAIGLPVFAKGGSGLDVFVGSTGGYLYGFLLGAALVGYFGDKYWNRFLSSSLLGMFLGTMVIIICGVIQLTVLHGWSKALEYGFYPVLPGALVKIFIGALLVWAFHKFRLTNKYNDWLIEKEN